MECGGGGRRQRRCHGGAGYSLRNCSPWAAVSHTGFLALQWSTTQRGPTDPRGRVLVNTWNARQGSAPPHSWHSRTILLAGFLQARSWGFPGGSVVENLPPDAGDTGLIPGPRRSHTLQSNLAHVPRLLSPRACALQQQKP